MNGFIVFAIDLEGYGYSAGSRITNLTVDKFHHQVSTLLFHAGENAELPAFLLGHSMGCLAINTYLHHNPKMAEKLAGVIYSAPFFGLGAQQAKKSPLELWAMGKLADGMDELVLIGGMATHKLCRNKQFVRMYLNQRKANPFLTGSLAQSILQYHEVVQKNPQKVTYPYQVILGDKDILVDNAVTQKWHEATQSKTKDFKRMAGAYHELSKETNNKDFFETILKFCAKRQAEGAQGFGKYDFKDVKI